MCIYWARGRAEVRADDLKAVARQRRATGPSETVTQALWSEGRYVAPIGDMVVQIDVDGL